MAYYPEPPWNYAPSLPFQPLLLILMMTRSRFILFVYDHVEDDCNSRVHRRSIFFFQIRIIKYKDERKMAMSWKILFQQRRSCVGHMCGGPSCRAASTSQAWWSVLTSSSRKLSASVRAERRPELWRLFDGRSPRCWKLLRLGRPLRRAVDFSDVMFPLKLHNLNVLLSLRLFYLLYFTEVLAAILRPASTSRFNRLVLTE